MNIEDILSGVGVAILIGISVISRYRQRRANRGTATLEHPSKVENNEYGDMVDFEQNIQEIAEKSVPKKVKTKKKSAKNATNQTFSKPLQVEKTADKDSKPSRKFNMRDAVIYSEILNPKFKQEE